MSHDPRLSVLSLTQMHEVGLQLLRDGTDLRFATGIDPATLQREIVGADGLVIRTGGIVDGALMDCADRLKVVGRHGVGYDAIDIPQATAHGIQVVYTPGANTQSVAEAVIAMMIGLSRHYTKMFRAVEAYDYHARLRYTGRDLKGRTRGIIGFGRIGQLVGALAKTAFDMKVVYHDIIAPPPEAEALAGATRLSFEDVLRTSEYVSLHVPLDATTRRMINRETLALMRPDAILINACRGPVVDEQAVSDALEAKKLWGFGADVYDVEPPKPGHPIIGREDVMLTPHSAAQTEEGLYNMSKTVAEEVLRVLKGTKPEFPVNDPEEVEAVRQRLGLKPLYQH